MSAASIAPAVWAYSTRTLASGTPDAPADRAEQFAEAIWEYTTRELTESSSTKIPVFMTDYRRRR
jgi:hypothetical protein